MLYSGRSRKRSKKRSSKKGRKYSHQSSKGCKRGYIRRSAYRRKSYTKKSGTKVRSVKVSSHCIKSRGSGHGLKLGIKLKKGSLTQHGYSVHESTVARHRALSKAIKVSSPLSVFRKINYLVVVNKSHPSLKKKFESDRNWIKKNYNV